MSTATRPRPPLIRAWRSIDRALPLLVKIGLPSLGVAVVAAMLTGNVVIYLVGLPWLAAVVDAGLEKTLELGLYPFVPGDVLKLYLAGALLPAAWRLAGRRGPQR